MQPRVLLFYVLLINRKSMTIFALLVAVCCCKCNKFSIFMYLGSSSAEIGGAVAGSIVAILVFLGIILYCRYRIKTNINNDNCSQLTENLTTSHAYGMATTRCTVNQQETYAYATVGNANSLRSSSPMTSNPAYSTTSPSSV